MKKILAIATLPFLFSGVAFAQCTGAGGVPFNCKAGPAVQPEDLVMGGNTAGADTVKWTWQQVYDAITGAAHTWTAAQTFSGFTTFGNTATFNGAANFNGAAAFGGSSSFTGTSNFSGASTFSGTSTFSGPSTFTAPVSNLNSLNIMAPPFNAKCDGTTDDQAAIQAAINAAGAGNIRVVFSPPSKTACMLGSKLTLPASGNVTLYAYPGTQSWKATATNNNTPQLIDGAVNWSSNIFIYGLDLDGNIQGQFAAGGAQKATTLNSFFRSDNVVFDHVNIHDSASSSILFSTRITHSGIRNSTVSNIGMHFQKTNLLADVQQGISFISNNAIFTGAITGSVLTVSTMAVGGIVDIGSILSNFTGVIAGTRIISRGTGTGATGTYNLNVTYGSPIVATTMASTDRDLNVGNFAEDNIFIAHGGGPVNVYANSGFSAQRNKCFLGTDAVFTAAMNGTNLPVTAVASGFLKVGQLLYGLGVPDGAKIVNYIAGSTQGSVGTYSTNVPAGTSITSRTMYAAGFSGRDQPSLQSVFSNVGQPCILGGGVKGMVVAGNESWSASEGAYSFAALEDYVISGNYARWNRSYGIAMTSGIVYNYMNGSKGGSITGNTLINSGTQYSSVGNVAGILFLTGSAPVATPGPVINAVISGNLIQTDDPAATSGYGIANADFGAGLVSMQDVKVSDDNVILGMIQGPLLNLSFTVTGCSATAPVGSQRAGTFTAGITGTCAPVITIGGSVNPQTAAHGYRCTGTNMTSGVVTSQTSTTVTTCTLSVPSTTGDVIVFNATPY